MLTVAFALMFIVLMAFLLWNIILKWREFSRTRNARNGRRTGGA